MNKAFFSTEFNSINPCNSALLATFHALKQSDIQTHIEDANISWKVWRNVALDHKAQLLQNLASVLKKDLEENAQLISLEMGKPIKESRAEIEKCADLCKYYASHANDLLSATKLNEQAHIQYEALGLILGIMPWNFPFWQAFRFAIPTLMAGNVVIIKHAPNTPQCALAIQKIFDKAQFPKGVCQQLFIAVADIETVIANPLVKGVSLTGSNIAGRAVAQHAAKYLKPVVLELGGSDAFMLTKNANISLAVEKAVLARCRNNGQSCVAAKRFIIDESIYDSFKTALINAVKSLKIGNPTDEHASNGPLARRDLYEKVQSQLKQFEALGFRKIFELENNTRLENVIPPMIWEADVKCEEEIFAPVFVLYRAKNIAHAIELANDSIYGLGASVWTENTEEAQEISAALEAGMVYINELVYSDPSMPFGGIKQSGIGKELGAAGIRAFTNQKLVYKK